MPRELSPEELADVAETEQREAERRARELTLSSTVAAEGQLKLYDPDHDALKFGEDGDRDNNVRGQIRFGEVEPHVALVPADHPLLPALLRRYTRIVVYEPGEKAGVTFACDECDKEFRTKAKLRTHRGSAHGSTPERAAPRPAAAATRSRERAPTTTAVDDRDDAFGDALG